MVVGEFTTETDLAIIGGGPGGYTAAFRAAELGVQTVLIDDRDALGGVCLHSGCIPSKTLLHIAEVIRAGEHAAQFGVTFAQPQIDVDRVRNWLLDTRATLAKALNGLAKKHGVEVVNGRAAFEDSRRLSVPNSDSPRIRFRRAIIATGTTPKPHPRLPFDGERVIDAAKATEIPTVPLSLLIVGYNYNAIELASIYAALGSAVTLVDESEMLPEADPDLSRPLLKRLKGQLEHMASGVIVDDSRVTKDGVEVSFSGGDVPRRTRFDEAIVVTELMPNVNGLGLEKTAVNLHEETGFIVVDDQLRTTDPRIFAIGDVTGPPLLADQAMLQGRIAAEVAAGWNSTMDRRAVASVIFTDPQLAWCGLTEAAARAQGINHEVVKLPWGASGRAVSMGRTDGLTKIVYDPDTKLVLGVGIAGTGAAELIAEGVLAIEMGAVLDDLAGAIHPHPTLSELIPGAAQRVVEE